MFKRDTLRSPFATVTAVAFPAVATVAWQVAVIGLSVKKRVRNLVPTRSQGGDNVKWLFLGC
jgi:hypothetical protein